MSRLVDGTAGGEGAIKQTAGKFDAKHAAHGGVDVLFLDDALVDEILQMCRVAGAVHVHFHARGKCFGGTVLEVTGNALANHLTNGAPVGHNKALKAHLIAQKLGQIGVT